MFLGRPYQSLSAALAVALCLIAIGCADHAPPTDQRSQTAQLGQVTVSAAVQHDTSPPLRTIRPVPFSTGKRVMPLRKPTKPHVRSAAGGASPDPDECDPETDPNCRNTSIGAGPVIDPVLQEASPSLPEVLPGGGFEGVGQGFTGPNGTYSVGVAPPDTNGEIGPNHYVQIVNLAFAVFDKSGTPLLGPLNINTLWSGFGGHCETDNSGDPVVVYDQLADRWVVSQFSLTGNPYFECVAVSATGDPTGAYHRYAFSYASFPDYPKMGVWPDAYYVTFNVFGSSFLGSQVCAYDRTSMLAGAAATQQCTPLMPAFDSLLPADLDGTTLPPPGAPNYLMNADAPASTLNLFKYHVDWQNPANTTFSSPAAISVAPFAEGCGGFGDCVPQSGTTQLLEGLGDRLMFRLAYRNFGDHESLVVNQSVNVTSGSSTVVGARWYEIRDPGGAPAVFQQSTYAPPDGVYRWMGSLAQDRFGNMALGFSTSSSTTHPGIHYTGRLFSDPAGTMTVPEGVIIDGPAFQSGVNRWGDYSDMTVDPTDDCTFWYTTEYQAANGGFNWHTRIGSFKISCCEPGPLGLCSIGASPTTLEGGNPSTGTVVLNGVAPAEGAVVSLSTSDPTLASVPASVTVAAGAQSATFSITTHATPTQTPVIVTGTFPAGSDKTATLTLLASPTPTSLTLSPTSVMGSQSSTATVTLSGAAPSGGAVVALTSSSASVATVPASVTVAAGDTSASFPVTTSEQIANTAATISAAYHALTRSAVLTVTRTVPVGNAAFDPTLKAPRCNGVEIFCDSGGLIEGRDNILNGAESNTPNTINNSCIDHTTGAFHSDESLDRLKISTVDGTPLAAGKMVNVEATAWAYNSSDFLDLFFAPDAANPAWSAIGTKQATSSGLQVLTFTFALPGGPLPAIRGNWRYLGGPGSCTSGTYDEADDLVFAAGSGTIDTTPPTATITAPAEGSIVNGSVSVNVDATDNVGVVRVELYDDGSLSATDTTVPYSFPMALGEGPHTLVAKAFDASGNSGSSTVTVTVDNTPPTVSITAPANGTPVKGTITVDVAAADASGIGKVELRAAGVTVSTDTVPPYSFALNTTSYADGPLLLEASAYDVAGNSATTTGPSVSVTVDNTPPSVAITSPAPGSTVSGNVTITVAASDATTSVTAVDFLVDGTVIGTDTTSPYSFGWSSTSGPHTLLAKARDDLSNEGTSAPVTVTGGAQFQYVWPEAESGAPTAPLQIVSNALASGGKFIQVAPGNNSSGAPPTSGHAKYAFSAAAAGTYKVWGRVIAPTNSDDSWWVRIDSGTWNRWNGIPVGTSWHWDDVHNDLVGPSATLFSLAAGAHTLEIAYREDGAQLDRLLITNDLAFIPTGFGPPAPPTGLTAKAGDALVTLAWTAPTGASTYNVKRGNQGGPYAAVQTGVSATTFPDASAVNGTKYCYVVTAVNSLGESGNSNEACATPTSSSKVYLWPEAESAAITSPMQKLSDALASAGQYIAVAPGNNSATSPPTNGHATISFTAPTAGTYKVWGRVIAPTSADDSFWVRIDAGAWQRWNGIPLGASWHWDDVHDDATGGSVGTMFSLGAGSHTLEIAYREDGCKLDRLLITNDTAFTPTGSGPQ